MDATIEMLSRLRPAVSSKLETARGKRLGEAALLHRPTRVEAEAAVRTLIRWAGDDPAREGLRDTPARVARAYGEWFCGYGQDPEALLERTFDEIADMTAR